MSTITGLRTLKKERTRDELTAIAARMFAERGYEAVTVDEIAAEAFVSPRTFYRYFPSKEDLVLGDVEQLLAVFRGAFVHRPAGESVIVSIRVVVGELAEQFETTRETNRQQAELIETTPALKIRQNERQLIFEAGLTPLIAERLGITDPTDLRAPLIAACSAAAMRVAIGAWVAGGAAQSLPELVDHALALLIEGLKHAAPTQPAP